MYKTVCGDAPDYLKNDFVFTSGILKITKIIFQCSALYIETLHIIISLSFSGTSIWNYIPEYTCEGF